MDDKFLKALKIVAPGTLLREGLEQILRARTGALIVLAEFPVIGGIIDGGFKVDTELMPSYLYELSKMDGAIILSKDAKRILYANVQLLPDPSIPSYETGIRHRTAERVARQTGELVIAISERRNMITLYQGTTKYLLRDIGFILAKANQALQTLERYKSILDSALENLTYLEFEDLVTLGDVAAVLQKINMVARVQSEIERYVIELGTEGRLVSMQLEDVAGDVKMEAYLLVRDYLQVPDKNVDEVYKQIVTSTSDELVDVLTVARGLGFPGGMLVVDQPVSPKGYRIMRRIPRLPMNVVENLVNKFSALQSVLNASVEELDEVEGIGEVRARHIRDSLRRLREQYVASRKS